MPRQSRLRGLMRRVPRRRGFNNRRCACRPRESFSQPTARRPVVLALKQPHQLPRLRRSISSLNPRMAPMSMVGRPSPSYSEAPPCPSKCTPRQSYLLSRCPSLKDRPLIWQQSTRQPSTFACQSWRPSSLPLSLLASSRARPPRTPRRPRPLVRRRCQRSKW